MGNPKQKWTAEEEEALRAGVAKHGAGKWKNIQKDPDFNPFLHSRSNIDLKDKWRNMSVSANGLGPREKSRTPKLKPNPDVALLEAIPEAAPLLLTQAPDSSTPLAALEATPEAALDDKCSLDQMNAYKYNTMIFETLSSLNAPNGSDMNAIVAFIEQRQEVAPSFRRTLGSRLRRLVAQDKLERVQNCYRIKKNVLPEANAATSQQKEICIQPDLVLSDPELSAAKSAAYKIVVAENKEYLAAEASREFERVSRMAEESYSMLQFAQEILDKCLRGETVLVA